MPLPTLTAANRRYTYHPIDGVAASAPFCVRVLAENVARHVGRNGVTAADFARVAAWSPASTEAIEVPFHPARVLMQDYTGIPGLIDLAALRDGMARAGGDPKLINPQIPVDLVIDHSLTVDRAGSPDALRFNLAREFERNAERYALAKWAQLAFDNLRVVPPGNGILHQVNIEHIARVVRTETRDGATLAYPDTMVGTDSHSTMVNGIGVVGWGVGGIEAEAAMLGLPLVVALARIVGVRLSGRLREGVTATDLVLTLTQRLRQVGVVDALLEFFGPALDHLAVADRVTISNMSPEFGSTCAVFPIDAATISYLELTGRDAHQVALVEAYAKAQGLWRDERSAEPKYSSVVDLDLTRVEPSVAGPRKPQSRVALGGVAENFRQEMKTDIPRERDALSNGSIVVAAITSCTNTSNPAVMLAAGLLARKSVARGLRVKPWVKTSLTPGSRVVGGYLEKSGLQASLDALGFHVAGYGCATCGGMSGELAPEIEAEIASRDLVACAVLSGNRNFEARIHPLARANYLMSPPLVVAYAIAGHIGVDLTNEPLGTDGAGEAVYLRDVWPTSAEIEAAAAGAIDSGLFATHYVDLFEGGDDWRALEATASTLFPWDPESTYIRRPPYLDQFSRKAAPIADIRGARPLLILGDAITTDHISPVGSIATDSPAARHLVSRGVPKKDFNAYGARRANHEVMVRGTFANIRLRNEMVDREGGLTRHAGSGEVMSVYDAAMRYADEGTPLVVIAGREYGAGSSRDWAAKGSALLGVRAVIAESFERIHRANLTAMGVLPLQFPPGVTRATLALDGSERIDLIDLDATVAPRSTVRARIHRSDGASTAIDLLCRIDTASEAEVWRAGGMMPFVLRRLARTEQEVPA